MNPVSGGPCQGIRYINSETERHGATREVVCLDDPESKYIGMDSFPIHALGPTKNRWRYSAKLRPWLDANLERFDIVIINGLWVYSSYAGFKALEYLHEKQLKNPEKNIKIPKMFVMPHGMLDPYFQRAKTRRLKALRNIFYWILIEHKVINYADAILFTSKTELLLARETFFWYRPKKEIDVGYGIYPPPPLNEDIKKAFFECCPKLNSKPYLLFLSRIHEKKGLDLLIKAYATIVQDSLVERSKIIPIVVAGPGLDSNYGKRIQSLIESLPGIKDLVYFVGMISGDTKWGALYGCEAFILPSHQENFGIAVVEALACKKAVLISNQVNIWLEIIEGGGGLVVPDTLEATKKMLLQWLNLSQIEKETTSANALQIFLDKFHIEQTSRMFLEAIS